MVHDSLRVIMPATRASASARGSSNCDDRARGRGSAAPTSERAARLRMTVKKRPSELNSLERFNLYYREEEEELAAGERCRRFIWNHKTHEFCGRTASSWYKISLFYLTFYVALGVLVAVCMWTFLQLLDARAPRWTLHESIIGTNPGLGFRPSPPEVASSVIWFRVNDSSSYRFWVDELSRFLATYEGGARHAHKCDFRLPPPAGEVCAVEPRAWAPCVAEEEFGYRRATPCIFLKLNKIYGWRPRPYADRLPADMPAGLQAHVRNVTAHDRALADAVWVSCEGQYPLDAENLGPVEYLPHRGFPAYYFPYTNQAGYRSPLVAVHFRRPRTGVLINVECRVWAHNILYDRRDRLGSVHFELFLE